MSSSCVRDALSQCRGCKEGCQILAGVCKLRDANGGGVAQRWNPHQVGVWKMRTFSGG